MSKRLTTKEFIMKANHIHHNEYDYSLVNYLNNRTKIKIICLTHGIFEQQPDSHLRGRGCPICYGKLKSNINEFINKVKIIHNNKYDYSKSVYINNTSPISIICPKHGEFFQEPKSHLIGKGCAKCAGLFMNTEYFIEKANKIHSNKYDYSKVVYVDNISKVKIICPKHGEFEQKPNYHLGGSGCSYCCGHKCNKDVFIEKAKKIHGNKYDYSNSIYISNRSKIEIICPIHGSFIQKTSNHLVGSGCPICKSSKGEQQIINYLKNNNIKFEHQKKFDDCIGKIFKLPFDFYLQNHNILIEFDGKQHFEIVKFNKLLSDNEALIEFLNLKQNDIIKNEYCSNNNIQLIRISYKEKNINEFLNNKLINILKPQII